MSTVRAEARPGWWRAVASPGFGGYVLAFLVSAGVMGVGVPLEGIIGQLAHWSLDFGELFYVTAMGVYTMLFAVLYGFPAAVVGCLLVHLVCLRIPEQLIHVTAAGLVGMATGAVYDAVLFNGYWDWLWLLLGIATAIGRAAVIPLARRRQR